LLQLRSIANAADNTGAHKLYIIHIYGGSRRKWGNLGSLVRAVVKTCDPIGMVKRSEQVVAVIVRTRKAVKRKDGSYIRFDDNAIMILNSRKDLTPKGTRIFGPIAREIKDLGYAKIASMAPEVL
jgi:large subunit ribosomal protein L14